MVLMGVYNHFHHTRNGDIMYKYEVKWDKETNTVSCGALSLQRYTEMTPANFFSKVTDGKHLVVKSGEHYVQSLNKARCDEFDTSFIATYKHFMKLQYKAFVASIPSKVVNNYCRRWYKDKSINTTILNMVNQRINIINQTITDGNSNILPFVVFSGKTPKELKQEFGKGLWKRLCKNSEYRNRVIFGTCAIKQMYHFPTSVLEKMKVINGCGVLEDRCKFAEFYTTQFKGKWTKITKSELWDMWNTLYDTNRMATQLGYKFKWNQCYDDIKKLHSEYAKAIRDMQYSDKPFSWIHEKGICMELEYKGYKIVLLDNPRAIREEGDIMKHCVASYTTVVADGKYLVFSVQKDGVRTSTVGYTRQNNMWIIHQHYGKCNQRVTDDDEISIVKRMFNELNKD